MPQRKKLSTTIGANNHAYLLKMVKTGKADSVEHETAAYFKGLTRTAVTEEADLENALSAASQEMDLDQP
jgi:hypothetical protein